MTDNFYRSNAAFYRINQSGKKVVQGGTQIEIPIQYAGYTSSGWYQGFDVLDTTPQDNVKNAAYDWKQTYVTATLDGMTVAKNDSPESVANIVTLQISGATQQLEENCGSALFSDAVTNTKMLDGLQGAIDNGTVAATYGGLGNRTTTNSFWQPLPGGLDTTTTTLTLAAMQNVFGSVTDGARHPTLILTTQANYNRFWNLCQVTQRFPTQPMGSDEQLASAGFTNLLFNNVPVVVDSHCNTSRAGTTGDSMYFIDEEYWNLYVMSGHDVKIEDWQSPINQDAMSAKILFYGALVFSNIRLQGAMTALTA